MQKQQAPLYWTPPPPPPPLYQQFFSLLRRFAFAIVAMLVVVTFIALFFLFSGGPTDEPVDLTLYRTIAQTHTPPEPPAPRPKETPSVQGFVGAATHDRRAPRANAVDTLLLPQPHGATPAIDSTGVPVDPLELGDPSGQSDRTSAAPPPATAATPRRAESHAQPSHPAPARKTSPRAVRTIDKPRTGKPAPAPEQEAGSEETPGRLLVTSQPSGASVHLNGEFLGRTPLTTTAITPGLHKILLHSEGYESFATRVLIKSRQTSTLHGQLTVPLGALDVQISPGGSTLYIDETLRHQHLSEPYRTRLSVGPHRVKAVHPTLGTWENVVYISKDQREHVVILFNQQTASSSSADNPTSRPANPQPAEPAAAQPARFQKDADGIYTVVETPPELIGGLEALHRRVHYPEKAYQAGIQGRVYIQVIVDEKGRVHQPTIRRGLPLGCNAEALRAVKQVHFKPGTIGNQPVKTRHTLFIDFKIDA